MATVTLGKGSFEEAITSNEVVLVDFWAAWCGPCQRFSPLYEAASEQHKHVVFAKMDIEAEQDLAARFEIMSIPTLMAFQNQILVYSQPGALSANALEDRIEKLTALDMTDVRRQMEARANAAS